MTETLRQIDQAKSVLLMEPGQTLPIAALNPKLLLEGDVPRLIDERQLAPQLWDVVRREVDCRKGAAVRRLPTKTSKQQRLFNASFGCV